MITQFVKSSGIAHDEVRYQQENDRGIVRTMKADENPDEPGSDGADYAKLYLAGVFVGTVRKTGQVEPA